MLTVPESHSELEYNKTVEYAKERGYGAMYWAMVEDGYSSDVDWKSLRHDGVEDSVLPTTSGLSESSKQTDSF